MAKYVYEKWSYTITYSPSYSFYKNLTEVTTVGYTSFTMNSSTGTVTYGGTYSDSHAWANKVTIYNDMYTPEYGTVSFRKTPSASNNIWIYDRIIPSPTYNKGSTYYGEVIAEDGTYPNNGVGTESGTLYWFVKVRPALPQLYVNINGNWKLLNDGQININGVWKQISELWVKIDGVWRKS